MYHIFFIHSSVNGDLGCLHVLAVVNSVAVNIGVHVSFLNYDLLIKFIFKQLIPFCVVALGPRAEGKRICACWFRLSSLPAQGWVVIKEGSGPGTAALRALPPSICELSAELSSRTPCTFRESDARAPLKTDMTLSHSPLSVQWH